MFSRSKKGWVSERDANDSEKWDVFTINPDGSDPVKWVENASWASWISGDEIVFVRGTKILRKKGAEGEESELMDSEGVAGAGRGAVAAAGALGRRQIHRHHAARVDARDRDLGPREEDLEQDRARLPDRLDARTEATSTG